MEDLNTKNVTSGHQDAKSSDVYEFPFLRNFLRKHQNIAKYMPFLPSSFEELATKSESMILKNVNSK